MARKPFHQQLQENLEALRDGKEPPHKRAEEQAREEFAKLDDAKHQKEIMNPAGVEVEFSFGKLRLYPFALFDQATASGFCDEVIGDALHSMPTNKYEAAYRSTALITKSPKRKRELLALLAIITEKPGVIDSDDKGAPIVADLATKMQPNDYVLAYNEILTRAKVKHDLKKA